MAFATEQVNFKFGLNFNSKSYICLVATVWDNTALDHGGEPDIMAARRGIEA